MVWFGQIIVCYTLPVPGYLDSTLHRKLAGKFSRTRQSQNKFQGAGALNAADVGRVLGGKSDSTGQTKVAADIDKQGA